MQVCKYESMKHEYENMKVCDYVSMRLFMYACIYLCMFASMKVCMFKSMQSMRLIMDDLIDFFNPSFSKQSKLKIMFL